MRRISCVLFRGQVKAVAKPTLKVVKHPDGKFVRLGSGSDVLCIESLTVTPLVKVASINVMS
jgi:hypothetical protein